MALEFQTFSNRTGGDPLFKAIGHPLAARRLHALLDDLSPAPFVVYDPLGQAATVDQLFGLSRLPVAAVYVQNLADVGRTLLGHAARPVTELPAAPSARVLLTAFDSERLAAQVGGLLPPGGKLRSLDEARLPAEMLSNRRDYLDGLNFATNFVLFRDTPELSTRLVTANYWSGYGAKAPALWCCLFDGDGRVLAEWEEPLGPAGGTIAIESREVRRRFALDHFEGQLYVHLLRVAGHDVVKYALDVDGPTAGVLSCTHDANAWPGDLYAGLPAPAPGERVLLWIQNSHPVAIPAGAVGLNRMGEDAVSRLDREVPPFGTLAVDVATLLPELAWPAQIEVRAGKHFVRPRYEVLAEDGHRRIAHANVERTDLQPDPQIPGLTELMGKGFILPAPVLPPRRYHSLALPTPMSTAQRELPLAVTLFDPDGREVAREPLGRLPRDHARAVDVDRLLEAAGSDLGDGWAHLELTYDFADGGEADGWLHALFRYRDRDSGHTADTSFGAHIFNSVLVYRNEPQSYAGRPPGLSTRLFLRLGPPPLDTLCHLIYPASTVWHARSETRLLLLDRTGTQVAESSLRIACGGSALFRASEVFGAADLRRAEGGSVLIRDHVCRLFGYHGLCGSDGSFSLDHMFGF